MDLIHGAGLNRFVFPECWVRDMQADKIPMSNTVADLAARSQSRMQMDRLTHDLTVFLDDIARCRDRLDLFKVLTAITRSAGYRYFIVLGLPQDDTSDISQQTTITSAPRDLISAWQAAGFFREGRVMRQIRQHGGPFAVFFHDLYADDQETLARLETITGPHGVSAIAACPVMHPLRGQAIIAFLGNPAELDPKTLATLYLVAAKINDRLCEITMPPPGQAIPISNRERECLEWTAAGKTSNEIAGILGLSEHTVNHYLNHAARKIGAVNRAQAVALCMRNGWID